MSDVVSVGINEDKRRKATYNTQDNKAMTPIPT